MEEGMIRQALRLKETDAGSYSPLVLAYIGDAVYEVLIRMKVLNQGNRQVSKMHKKCTSLVKAQAQAEMILLLMEDLSEEETMIYKRGRNAKSSTVAKHAAMREYRMATGLESLVGYLYLTGRHERLLELIHDGLERMGELS